MFGALLISPYRPLVTEVDWILVVAPICDLIRELAVWLDSHDLGKYTKAVRTAHWLRCKASSDWQPFTTVIPSKRSSFPATSSWLVNIVSPL